MKFLDTVHSYERDIERLKARINKEPENWQAYQSRVDDTIDSVFNLCWEFERQHADDETRLYKMKRLFNKNFMHYFRLGRLGRMVIDKPFGYHGDFLVIDEIYNDRANTTGVERCLDNYFLKTPASIATRNRKEDFKHYLRQVIEKGSSDVRIMDLASGPCRDIRELLETYSKDGKKIIVDCIDHDQNAIDYGKSVIHGLDKHVVNFIQRNAMRIALAPNIDKYFSCRYDVIFSTGLFDYLHDRIAVPLIKNLRKLLKDEGCMIISNYRDKWANPSRHFMEWGGGWELIYRTEGDFLRLFKEAGISGDKLSLRYEAQKIMQYRFARK